MTTKVRLPELDLLRFLAACSVMLFHYTFLGPQKHLWSGSFPLLGDIFRYGHLGVDLFFTISGFVILLTAYEKDALSFAIARMVRLYPAYWICVSATSLALVLFGGGFNSVTFPQYLANLTMVQSYLDIKDVSGVYWTLAVELKFYFLIFVILCFRQIHRLSVILGFWLAASIVLSLGAPRGVAWFFLFPEWSSYFIAGAMLFLIHREGPSPYKLSIIAACFLLSIGYVTHWLPATAKVQNDNGSPWVSSIVIAVIYFVFLAIALRRQRLDTTETTQRCLHLRAAASKVIPMLGLMTYPLYLIHQDLGFIVLRSAPPYFERHLVLVLGMTAMLALSWAIYFGPEKWLALRLKNVLRNLRKSLSGPPAAMAQPETQQIDLRLPPSEALLRRTSDRGVEQPGSSSGS